MSARSSNANCTRRQDDRRVKTWFLKNHFGLCCSLVVPLLVAHCTSNARSYTTKFLPLAYYNQKTGEYGLGFDDIYLVSFFAALFTGLRAGTVKHAFVPLAEWHGLHKEKSTRFSEQAWMVIYYLVFWPLGMYIYVKSSYYSDLREIWTKWPNRENSALMKGYILAQLAFWLQQIIIINVEKHRKDHWQMFTHHVITVALIYSSYCYGHTRAENVVLVLMDTSDIVLSLAKCLRYLGHQKLCDVMFGVFVLSWAVCRHVWFPMVCWSVYAHTPVIMTVGCFRGLGEEISGPMLAPEDTSSYLFEPLISSSGLVCYDSKVRSLFLGGLLFLQLLTILWFIIILRLAVTVLSGASADDVRSDDGEE